MPNFVKQASSLILPITVLVLVPLSIEKNWTIAVDSLSIAGMIPIAGGLILLVGTISTLTRIGKGTLAPWSPTSKLVVGGAYAYTRNPMISSVLCILLGESLIVHSTAIFIWLALFFIINNIYFVFLEEPGLVKRFGSEYVEYKRNVPQWIPRLRPWIPPV